MSVGMNVSIADFVTLFQETWAECAALHAKERLEASGRRANWEEILGSAQAEARELFRPVFVAFQRNAPLPPVLKQLKERLEVSRKDKAKASEVELVPV